MDTHIISKNSEYALINNKLKDIYKSKIQYELIYRASVDGAFGKIFKKKCLNVRRTLIVDRVRKIKYLEDSLKLGGMIQIQIIKMKMHFVFL